MSAFLIRATVSLPCLMHKCAVESAVSCVWSAASEPGSEPEAGSVLEPLKMMRQKRILQKHKKNITDKPEYQCCHPGTSSAPL